MPKPALTETGERLYNWLASFFWTDSEHEWVGAKFLSALAKMLDPGAEVVQPQSGKPGFAILLDPELCPEKWLPWLGQFVGIDTKLSQALVTQGKAATVREWIKAPLIFQRGAIKGMEEAARATMTGAKKVTFIPRYEGVFGVLRVVTITAETPNPTETKQAIEELMPAWVRLIYEAVATLSYSQLEIAHATYTLDEGAHVSYGNLEAEPQK